MNVRRPPRSPSRLLRVGMTLFEVLLALAIFMGSLAVLSQLLATGVRGALRAKLETEAVFRAESKMGELVAGAVPFQPITEQPDGDDDGWLYSVAIDQGPSDTLFVVTVTSRHPGATSSSDVDFSLSRLVRDPQVLLDAVAEESAAAAESE